MSTKPTNSENQCFLLLPFPVPFKKIVNFSEQTDPPITLAAVENKIAYASLREYARDEKQHGCKLSEHLVKEL